MGEHETQVSAERIMNRMENTLNKLEQMSYDWINTTDQLVILLNDAREYNGVLCGGSEKERLEASEKMGKIMDQLLEISFKVNNLSHQLEQETVYQRDTADTIRQIIDFLYAMTD